MPTPEPDLLVLVTRPSEAGQRLSAALRDRGQPALWWPAFELLAPTEVEPLHRVLRELARFELVVFVSPAAVRGFAALDGSVRWPASTAIAGAGARTLQLARSLLPGAEQARAIEVSGSVQSGSEAVWEALKQQPMLPQSVLIVRAESGREWLAERLREAGCRVECASVYRRVVHSPTPEQRAALAACCGSGSAAASVVTSSEAVAALDRQLADSPEIRAWLRRGLALCSHPRIAQALSAAGYSEVAECEPSAAALVDAIGVFRRERSTAQPASARLP